MRFRRAKSTGLLNIITPTIIIRLVGESIRNHAVSTLDMRSRWVIRIAPK